jgi:hypothetical protein
VLGEVPFEKRPQPQTGLPTGNRHDLPSKTYLKAAGRESSRAVASLSYRSVPGTADVRAVGTPKMCIRRTRFVLNFRVLDIR